MVGKARIIRLFSLIVAAAMMLSVTVSAGALDYPDDVFDAKDDLATVEITQTCNGSTTNAYIHNYATDGDKVNITYAATLYMTEGMAYYLTDRQTLLMDAKFNVNINIENLKLLEFVDSDEDGMVTFQFASTFLKPCDLYVNGVKDNSYSYQLRERQEIFKDEHTFYVYEYDITVPANWIVGKDVITVPMELIVAYKAGEDGIVGTAYGYDEAKAKTGEISFDNVEAAASWVPDWNAELMYKNFKVIDWMYPITLKLAEMKVQDSVRPTVTTAPSTWETVKASGTIDGSFTYVTDPAATIRDLVVRDVVGFTKSLAFGNDEDITEWTSNDVSVLLKNKIPYVPDSPDSPYLNLEDHFAYIIGMPDGLVHPEWTITRAEVATIFFRMLTDEVRNEYWKTTNPYPDVQSTDWYNNAISTLTNLGIVNGMPDGNFHPADDITRAEFATMAVRFFIITEEYTWDEDAFSDIADHWANEYINLAYLLDIVHGYPDGTFRPSNAIDRAEAMTIVNNTLRRTPCNQGIEPMEDHEDFISWPDNMDESKWYYAAVQEATNSHEYTYFTEKEELLDKELWQDILPVRDWAAFEREWSTANSAANPGEVVSGH